MKKVIVVLFIVLLFAIPLAARGFSIGGQLGLGFAGFTSDIPIGPVELGLCAGEYYYSETAPTAVLDVTWPFRLSPVFDLKAGLSFTGVFIPGRGFFVPALVIKPEIWLLESHMAVSLTVLLTSTIYFWDYNTTFPPLESMIGGALLTSLGVKYAF